MESQNFNSLFRVYRRSSLNATCRIKMIKKIVDDISQRLPTNCISDFYKKSTAYMLLKVSKRTRIRSRVRMRICMRGQKRKGRRRWEANINLTVTGDWMYICRSFHCLPIRAFSNSKRPSYFVNSICHDVKTGVDKKQF